jgi:Pentapeptide repeats (8 copies)
MANSEHLDLLQQGVDIWNAWRAEKPSIRPDLTEANLRGADLRKADLFDALLSDANLSNTDLSAAVLAQADLNGADLSGANVSGANVSKTNLAEAHLRRTNLHGANLIQADLFQADLREADLSGADLSGATLLRADLSGANVSGADLRGAVLVEANLAGADLTGCRVYGVSAWNVKLSNDTNQQDLVITDRDEPDVRVDNIEVAQFVYLLLHNEKIRNVIDTIGKKGVLLLGRFTEGRIAVLERLRDELRKRGYLPIVFNFDKPETKDFTETVRLLAGLSKFVIADLTSPKSAPYELGAIVPQTMIPFQPIIAADETPFSMLQDLWINHPDRVFKPIYYSSVDALIASLDEKIIRPAEARFVELLKRKADTMGGEHV